MLYNVYDGTHSTKTISAGAHVYAWEQDNFPWITQPPSPRKILPWKIPSYVSRVILPSGIPPKINKYKFLRV